MIDVVGIKLRERKILKPVIDNGFGNFEIFSEPSVVEPALDGHAGEADSDEVLGFGEEASDLTLRDADAMELKDFFIKPPDFLSVVKGEEGSREGFFARRAAEALRDVRKAFESAKPALLGEVRVRGRKRVEVAGGPWAIGRGEVGLTKALASDRGFVWEHGGRISETWAEHKVSKCIENR